MKRVIVAGGIEFNDYIVLKEILDKVFDKKEEIEIISGHAKGTDSLGEKYAIEHGLKLTIFPAKWNQYGRAAGPIRNKEMLDHAIQSNPMLVAFWNGESRGTKNMIEIANNAKVETIIFNYNTNKLEHFNEDLSGIKESVESFYKEHEWLMNELAKGPDEEIDNKN